MSRGFNVRGGGGDRRGVYAAFAQPAARGGAPSSKVDRHITGSGITQTIQDGRGRTHSSVRGSNNNITFRGDHGANRFHIGGQGNNVNIFNLGRDDKVKLEGPGWREVTDSNKRDGKLRFENALTGSVVVVRTDAGRNDKFVRARVEYSKEAPPAPAPAAVTRAIQAAAVVAPPVAPPAAPAVPITVKRLDDHTLAVGDGTRKILLSDQDRDGYVDQVAVATREGSKVYTGTLQRAQTILAGTDGSDVKTQAYEGAANIALAQDLNSLQADAFDGKIDYEAAFNRAVQMLTRAETAGQGGASTTVMSAKADITLRNGSTAVALDAQNAGAGRAATETARIEFATGSYSLGNIFDGTGTDGAMDARLAQAGDGGTPHATFDVVDRATVGREATTHVFGAKYGSVGRGDVVNQGGGVDGNLGAVGQMWSRHSAMHELGLGQVARLDRLNGGTDAAPAVPAPAAKPTAA